MTPPVVEAREAVESWEDEGGSPKNRTESRMTGTPSQIEWAVQIIPRVALEFDRVANAFRQAAEKQAELDRLDTEAILVILEEKKTEVLSSDSAGYFIRDWQELTDQVRQLIFSDPRYQIIRAARAARLE